MQQHRAGADTFVEGMMDTADLTWRDKLAIADTTARIAAVMLLVIVAFCEVLTIVAPR